MKQIVFIVLAIFLSSCENKEKPNNTNSNEVELLKKENELLKKQMEVDSLKHKISSENNKQEKKEDETLINNTIPQKSNQVEQTNLIRVGKHQITLQWISFDENPSGNVSITKLTEDKYKIEGGQESRTNSDYLTINGTLKPINKNELIFEGTLIYKVEHNNSGLPCDKSGRHIFKSTQNRKYWRMQEMTNCEGGMLTDYVDIFF